MHRSSPASQSFAGAIPAASPALASGPLVRGWRIVPDTPNPSGVPD